MRSSFGFGAALAHTVCVRFPSLSVAVAQEILSVNTSCHSSPPSFPHFQSLIPNKHLRHACLLGARFPSRIKALSLSLSLQHHLPSASEQSMRQQQKPLKHLSQVHLLPSLLLLQLVAVDLLIPRPLILLTPLHTIVDGCITTPSW